MLEIVIIDGCPLFLGQQILVIVGIDDKPGCVVAQLDLPVDPLDISLGISE